MRRRRFLSALPIATSGIVQACNGPNLGDANAASGSFFPQSVASGDPRPHSVVLWTRVFDPERPGPLSVELQVATESDFQHLLALSGRSALTADAENDFCVKVRLDDLAPDQTYYYRFVYRRNDGTYTSRVGRTKTAPLEDSERSIRFAVMSCQDYGGRYYHAQRNASEQALDFVLFLGDYVYETTADPRFQTDDAERRVVFDDSSGALKLSEDELAARSLDNYRQLYRVYRSDANLQALHEQHPIVAILDDHEFTDDGYGQTGTYTAGEKDERDPKRRANADQAWFDYMPVDYPAGPDFVFDREAPFPENLQLYRDFSFGRHLHLVVTDLRRYRSGHVLVGNELPGAIAVDEEVLMRWGEAPDFATPYLDLDRYDNGRLRDALLTALARAPLPGWDSTQLHGLMSVDFITTLAQELELDLDPIPSDDLPRGIAFGATGKTEAYSAQGSRYLVAEAAFQLIARARWEDSDGQSEEVMGAEQEQWFLETLRNSKCTWKVWGNQYTLMRRVADLSRLPVPEALAQRFLTSADDWDGAPNRRAAILSELDAVDNLVVVTGDLHSFLVGNLGTESGSRIVEIVAGALTSATFGAILAAGLVDNLTDAGAGTLALAASNAASLLLSQNPHIAFGNLDDNGYAIVEAGPDALKVQLRMLSREAVAQTRYHESDFSQVELTVKADSGRVFRGLPGAERRFDPEQGRWIEA